LRERTYYYEILEPRHEPKPKIESGAKKRVTENLDRGLTVAVTADGKCFHIRNYIAHRSMGYPQSPVPSYYLGLPIE